MTKEELKVGMLLWWPGWSKRSETNNDPFFPCRVTVFDWQADRLEVRRFDDLEPASRSQLTEDFLTSLVPCTEEDAYRYLAEFRLPQISNRTASLREELVELSLVFFKLSLLRDELKRPEDPERQTVWILPSTHTGFRQVLDTLHPLPGWFFFGQTKSLPLMEREWSAAELRFGLQAVESEVVRLSRILDLFVPVAW